MIEHKFRRSNTYIHANDKYIARLQYNIETNLNVKNTDINNIYSQTFFVKERCTQIATSTRTTIYICNICNTVALY